MFEIQQFKELTSLLLRPERFSDKHKAKVYGDLILKFKPKKEDNMVSFNQTLFNFISQIDGNALNIFDCLFIKKDPRFFVDSFTEKDFKNKIFLSHALEQGYTMTQNDWDTFGSYITINESNQATDTMDTMLFLQAYMSNTNVNINELLIEYDGFPFLLNNYKASIDCLRYEFHFYKNFMINFNGERQVMSPHILNAFNLSLAEKKFSFKASKENIETMLHIIDRANNNSFTIGQS